MNIPVFRPLIEQEELDAATASLKGGWLGMGASVGEFERRVSDFLALDDRRVVAVSTGHAALHLALLLADVGPGDEVITPSFNNIADFQAILAVGATPVLCDIRDDTLCIDVDKAHGLITPRTKAIIPMDYDCCLADHDQISELASSFGLRVIHDAAHAFGSFYKGRKVGSFSDITMFSFDPVKTMTCVDGGALVVRSDEEMLRLHRLRLIGMGQPASVMYGNKRAWTYDVNTIGFRYHMANLHAAIGISQLSKMDNISRTRQASCKEYSRRLASIPEVRTPLSEFSDVTPFLYYIRVPSSDRDALRSHLSTQGVDTGIHWQPGHWFSLLRDLPRGDMSVTDTVGKEVLSLPLHSMMAEEDLDRVCRGIESYFRGQR